MTDKYELEQRLDKAEWVLNNAGFRRCDILACNCGSWHQVGGFKARFDEIREAVEEADYSTNGKILLDVVKEIIAEAKCSGALAQRPAVPEGATHMRRPEYLTAWLFDRKSTMPIWLIEKYQSRPLPDEMIGHYATAADGEFWRWFDPAKFNELFVAVSDTSTDREDK